MKAVPLEGSTVQSPGEGAVLYTIFIDVTPASSKWHFNSYTLPPDLSPKRLNHYLSELHSGDTNRIQIDKRGFLSHYVFAWNPHLSVQAEI